MRTITPDDDEYPKKLLRLRKPPGTLWVDGGILTLDRDAIGIVGPREPTGGAVGYATKLAAGVAARGTLVISGGARGIDRAAHEGAARTGTTWVLLPCGLDVAFRPPKTSMATPFPADLAAAIKASGGGFVTSFAPDIEALPQNHHSRNALVVALVRALVVVQAGHKSGSSSTAAKALKAGLRVYTFRGPCWDPCYGGTRALLAHGAVEPSSEAELLEALKPPSEPLRRASSAEKTLLRLLDGTARHVDELVDRTRLPIGRVTSALLTLALDDVVVEGPSGHFRRKST